MRLELKVTEQHIKRAAKHRQESPGAYHCMTDCAVALAIQELGYFCIIGNQFIFVHANGAFARWPIPEAIRAFIYAFDNKHEVSPIEFEMNL